jgi:hypothetical protein
MKRILISVACAIFISGMAQAREAAVNPTVTLHGQNISAARHVAQLNSAAQEGAAPCTTAYISTMRSDGTSYIRKSVDCEE